LAVGIFVGDECDNVLSGWLFSNFVTQLHLSLPFLILSFSAVTNSDDITVEHLEI